MQENRYSVTSDMERKHKITQQPNLSRPSITAN